MKSQGLAAGTLYVLLLPVIFYLVRSLLSRIVLLKLNAHRVPTFRSNRLILRDRLPQTWDGWLFWWSRRSRRYHGSSEKATNCKEPALRRQSFIRRKRMEL